MLGTPFSPWPAYRDTEVARAAEVLRSNRVNYWTGEEGRSFEREFADYSGAAHAVALANGSVALDLAWIALGIGEGDEVIVTPRSFQASAASIVLAGARPVFADVDPDSQNITAKTVAPLVNARTRAVLCVHLAGWPCDMDALGDLAAAHDLVLVEDCAQAHGARYRDRAVGSIGAVGAWSFCQDKIMTTAGEGGMVTTNDDALWRCMWSYKDHGKSWASVYEREHPPGYRWHHEGFGTNWRLPEIQSAIGRIQLRSLDDWRAQRRSNAARILEAAEAAGVFRVPRPPADVVHAWYKCYVFVEPARLAKGWDRDRIMAEIVATGVPCYSGSCGELYRERAFVDAGLAPAARLPVARELGERSLMFLVHPTLTEAELDLTVDTIERIGRQAAR